MTVVHSKMIVQCIYVIFAAVVCAAANQIPVPEVEINPSSILVPIGTTAIFECKVHHCPQTCSVYWVINGSSVAYDHQQNEYEEQGFIFNHRHNTTSNIYTRRIAITASVRVNNTEFYCLVRDGINPSRRTDYATLFVISESPLIPNPSVKNQNLTAFLLEWSPPFLWPGEHIEYFIITVTKLKDGSVIQHMVNTSFNDTIVSLTVELDPFMYDLCTCNEFLFKIVAIGSGLVELPSINVTGSYRLFALAGLCISNGELHYQSHQQDSESKQPFNEVHRIWTISSSWSWNAMASHAITSGLERDMEYSAMVNAWVETLEIQSHEVSFSTRFLISDIFTHCTNEPLSDANVFHYKLSMRLCLTVVVFLLLLLMATLMLKQVHHKRMKCSDN